MGYDHRAFDMQERTARQGRKRQRNLYLLGQMQAARERQKLSARVTRDRGYRSGETK